jgi:MerR family transcriptional regulator, redox-sensitive transcriptional activator SoxR
MTGTTIAKELTIGQLARRSGVATSALRFYEEQGLISSRRTTGNQRRYRRDMLRRVAFIRVSQNVGMPLTAIRAALDRLPESRTPNREDWAVVSGSWRADLDARIRQLMRLRDNLTDCIGCGCLSLDSCLLANPDDVCGRDGACGPQRLMLIEEDGETETTDGNETPHPACQDTCQSAAASSSTSSTVSAEMARP